MLIIKNAFAACVAGGGVEVHAYLQESFTTQSGSGTSMTCACHHAAGVTNLYKLWHAATHDKDTMQLRPNNFSDLAEHLLLQAIPGAIVLAREVSDNVTREVCVWGYGESRLLLEGVAACRGATSEEQELALAHDSLLGPRSPPSPAHQVPLPHSCLPPVSLRPCLSQEAYSLIMTFLERCDNSGNPYDDSVLLAAYLEALGQLRVARPGQLQAMLHQLDR